VQKTLSNPDEDFLKTKTPKKKRELIFHCCFVADFSFLLFL